MTASTSEQATPSRSAGQSAQRARLVVVRHGETVWNKEGRHQGHQDSELTELGIWQAQAVAAALEKSGGDILYSSDLGRALKTAEIISGRLGLPVKVEPGLRERNMGVLEGLTREEFKEKYPREYLNIIKGDVNYFLPGGESISRFYERTVSCVSDLAGRHAGQRVLLVAHGGVLTNLFRRAVKMPLEQPRTFSLYNASINEIYVSGEEWRLETWGMTEHLRELTALKDYIG